MDPLISHPPGCLFSFSEHQKLGALLRGVAAELSGLITNRPKTKIRKLQAAGRRVDFLRYQLDAWLSCEYPVVTGLDHRCEDHGEHSCCRVYYGPGAPCNIHETYCSFSDRLRHLLRYAMPITKQGEKMIKYSEDTRYRLEMGLRMALSDWSGGYGN